VAWECAECNVDDRQNRIDGVCHHCGKPLCRHDQVLIADDAMPCRSAFSRAGSGLRERLRCVIHGDAWIGGRMVPTGHAVTVLPVVTGFLAGLPVGEEVLTPF
jgi:hypothetical protein